VRTAHRLPGHRRLLSGTALAVASLATVVGVAGPVGAAAAPAPTTAPRYVLSGRVQLPGSVYSATVVPALNCVYVETTKYAGRRETSLIEAINLRTRRVVQRIVLPTNSSVPASVSALAVDPATRRIYVVTSGFNQGGGPDGPNTLTVYNAAGKKIATTTVGRDPEGISLDPATHRAYVSDSYDGKISVVNTTTHRVVRTIALPHASTLGPLLLDHATHRLLVAFDSTTGRTERVGVINTTNARVIRVLGVGGNGNPYGTNVRMALDPGSHQVWFGAFNVPAIRVVELHSLAVSTPLVATKRGIVGLAVDPASRTLFVSLPADAENTNMTVDPVNLRTRTPVDAPVATFNGKLADDPYTHGFIVYGQPNVRSQVGFLNLYSPRS
jgi:DNA-binding beta-propeller fold protein YncE